MKAIKNKVVIAVGKESTSTSATTGDKLRKAIIAGVKKLTGRTKDFQFEVTHDGSPVTPSNIGNDFAGCVLAINGVKNLKTRKQ